MARNYAIVRILQLEVAGMKFEPSRAEKLRSKANSFFGGAILFGLISVALAVGWYVGSSAPTDKPPLGMHQDDGHISNIERVHPPKEFSYIRLTIRSRDHVATWYYDEGLHDFAPALKTLHIGDFVSASIVPDRYGDKSRESVWQLRRGNEVLLSMDQRRAYREDNIATMFPFAIFSAVLAILFAFVGRALLFRAGGAAT
jgi:hypothetical protein